MKKSILLLSLSILSLALSSCGEEKTPSTSINNSVTSVSSSSSNSDNSVNSISSSTSIAKQFVVTFNGTNLPSTTVKEGEKLSEPTAPDKDGYIFAGWYLDNTYTTKATFPLTINKNLTIYAKYVDSVTYFNQARNKTITTANNFSYTFETTANATITGVAKQLDGKTIGDVKYNKNEEVSYLENHTNSGALFNDGTLYEYKKGDNVYDITLNENNEVTKFKSENNPNFKYESSSFAKSLFTYEDSDIKSLTKVSGNKYELKTTANFSSIASVVASNVDNPIVKAIFGVSIPDTDANFKQYVSFDDDGYLKTYTYSFKISVSKVNFDLTYSLTFTNVNASSLPITEPVIPGLILGEAEVNSDLNTIKNNINAYKALANSSYDYELKTELDEGATSLARSATVKGKTKRNVKDGTVYYNNQLEVDSNYKSDDFYGDKVEDYKRTRGVLSDKTVYDVENNLINDKGTKVTNPLDTDKYYFLPDNSLLNTSNVGAITENTTKNDDQQITATSYHLIVNNSFVTDYLDSVNSLVRLDPTLKNNIKVLGTYQKDSVEINDSKFVYNFNNNSLESISINFEGVFTTTLEGTNVTYENKSLTFKVSLTLTVTDDGENYTAPSEFKDLLK